MGQTNGLCASFARYVLMIAACAGGTAASALAGDGAYSNPWTEGDIFVNMSGEPVLAARADANGYESDPNSQSVAVTLFSKTQFFGGHVAMQDPTTPSDLFFTAPGEADRHTECAEILVALGNCAGRARTRSGQIT